MRVLIADRNARLLESIALTFAGQFEIHASCTRRGCADFLQQNEFDLVVISDKLADGPGLPLLGEIARGSPDTLRVFAAKRKRLQFLKGKLGPFGLFRTLAYPIDPRGLLSTLTLARAGLQIVESAPETQFRPPDVSVAPPVTQIRPPDISAAPPVGQIRPPDVPAAPQQPLSPRAGPRLRNSRPQPRNRASDPQSVALLLARLQPPPLVLPRPQLPTRRSAPSQTAATAPTPIRPARSAALPPRSDTVQREFAKRAAPPPGPAAATAHATAKAPSRATATASATVAPYRPKHRATPAKVRPKRARIFAGTALAAAVVAMIAIFRPFDGAARPASTEATLAANVEGSPAPDAAPDSALVPQIERPSAPSMESKRIVSKPSDAPALYPAQPTAETPGPAPFEVGAALSQTAAVSTPVADPSTFGSEAAEPIYSN
jgi:hypothetical protein